MSGIGEDLELLTEARAEYVERMQALAAMPAGAEFAAAADALASWIEEVNADLNDVAQDLLGEALAIDSEALDLLRATRLAEPATEE